jgi:membrane-associated phospholipid phosphatase
MAQIIKVSVRERRPDDTNDRSSFPSGHSATVFAFASVVAMDHGWQWGIPAYTLAAFVGYSRINDNRHYLHDVVAGATLGIGYGLGVGYKMRERSELPQKVSLQQIYVAPNAEDGESLVAIVEF